MNWGPIYLKMAYDEVGVANETQLFSEQRLQDLQDKGHAQGVRGIADMTMDHFANAVVWDKAHDRVLFFSHLCVMRWAPRVSE